MTICYCQTLLVKDNSKEDISDGDSSNIKIVSGLNSEGNISDSDSSSVKIVSGPSMTCL